MRSWPKTSGADHSLMRELNRSLVLDLVKQGSPSSRASISRVSALAKPTVSTIIDELLKEGLVREIGTGKPTSEGGRPPILLEFNARSHYLVGVHLGVSQTTIVVADARGSEIGRVQEQTSRSEAAEALARIATTIRSAITGAGASMKALAAVGVCVPGLVDLHTGTCLLAPNLGWTAVPVAEILKDALGVPVFVHNTTQASAVAENLEGAGTGASGFVFLYAGTGVGAGVISEGRLFHGADGFAGEIGHCRIPGATEQCNCGKIGCLETVGSGPAIARSAAAAIAAGRESSLASIDEGIITPEIVSAAADLGDGLALEVLADAGRALGTAASWLINLFNPQVLVIGGGLVGAGKGLIEPLIKTALDLALPQAAERLSVRTSELGQDAEARGAVLLALQSSETYYRVIFQN